MLNRTVPAAAEGMPGRPEPRKARRPSNTRAEEALETHRMLKDVTTKLDFATATLSQRVNELFGRYVAIEAEQTRLSGLGTKAADAEADALSRPALATMEEVGAIRDRSGNADLIVSRLLLELMLTNQWEKVAPGYEWLDWDQHNMTLPIIEALADRTTGVVRVHAAKALSTIGVEVVVETADPLGALIAEYRAALDAYHSADAEHDAADEVARAPMMGLWRRLVDECPAPTTMEGATEGVRLVEEDLRSFGTGSFHASVLAVVVAYFDGRAAS